MVNKKKIGYIGESAATAFLKSKGHIILGRNIRFKRGEIDILTIKDTTLHVVEVKATCINISTKAQDLILPEERFSKQKINRLKYLANIVSAKYSRDDAHEEHKPVQAVQIDGIAIRIYIDKIAPNQASKQGPNKDCASNILKITARYYGSIS